MCLLQRSADESRSRGAFRILVLNRARDECSIQAAAESGLSTRDTWHDDAKSQDADGILIGSSNAYPAKACSGGEPYVLTKLSACQRCTAMQVVYGARVSVTLSESI